jgi:hypothetical protein
LAAAAAVCASREEAPMKIVVVKSPRFLNGILRRIFGIKE